MYSHLSELDAKTNWQETKITRTHTNSFLFIQSHSFTIFERQYVSIRRQPIPKHSDTIEIVTTDGFFTTDNSLYN